MEGSESGAAGRAGGPVAARRIALVCDWFLPRAGGIELHLRDLAQRLAANGREVCVVTPTPGDDVVDGIRVHRVPGPRVPGLGFVYTRPSITAIGDVLARERVDVAHCHVSIVSPAALGGAYEAQRRGIAGVLTFHSIVPRTDMLMRAVRIATGAGRWPVVFSAVSDLVARAARPIAGGAPIEILRNGIDPDWWRAHPATPGRETTAEAGPRRIELVSVMRLNAKKRPFVLVELMRSLAKTLPGDRTVRLRIAGDGPLWMGIDEAIRREGLAERVELLGQLSREDVRALLAASDAFVLPSPRESFGLAAMEARCAGLPVVAMAQSGVAEFIRHGTEGLLARSDREWISAVARLVSDDALRDRMTAHNREAAPDWDWDRAVDQHLTLYERAVTLAAARGGASDRPRPVSRALHIQSPPPGS